MLLGSWRIRAKSRQPNFVHNGMTDHPDRAGTWFRDGPNPNGTGINGAHSSLPEHFETDDNTSLSTL
eukprot:COSAG04_NODE_1746_length_5716_cov_6.133701_7_plen_67_part_00